jgi:hypothetical protein
MKIKNIGESLLHPLGIPKQACLSWVLLRGRMEPIEPVEFLPAIDPAIGFTGRSTALGLQINPYPSPALMDLP